MKKNRTPVALVLAAATVAGLSFAGANALADHHEKDKMQGSAAASGKTIVDVAQSDEQFGTLVKAVVAADLAETLKGEGPYTVFAPTNEAFEKLPSGTLDGLLKPESKEKLQQILLYHVVSGEVMAADAKNLEEAETVQGGTITISAEGGKVMLNDSVEVVKTDIKADNGVIHVIDGVLMPKQGMGDAREGVQGIDEQRVEDAAGGDADSDM